MLLTIILTLLVVGVLMYVITAFVPMEPRIKQLLVVVVVIVLALWCLQEIGVLGSLNNVGVR